MNDQGAHQEPKDKALQEVVARLKDELFRLNNQLDNNLKKIKEFFLLGSGGKIIFDQDGSITEANQNFVEGMNAYSKERIIRSNIYDFFAENEKSILNKAVTKLLERQAESTHLIATMKRSDGSFFDASISLTVFSDLDTGTNLVFASITNITSQLNLHFELEEKKKLLSEAQKLSQFGYWHYSFANRKIHWSDEVYSIFEARKTDELGSFESFMKRVHPSDHDILFEFWKKISLRSQIESITIRIIVGDGSVKYVTMKAEMETDRSGMPFRILGTIIDVTENWYRERKIAENEELFHSLFNNLTDIFIIFELVFDGNGTIVDYTYKDVNPLFEMKLGFVRDEVVGKRLSLHLPSLYQQLHPLFKLTAIASEPQQDRLYIPLLDSFVDVLIYSPSSNMIATIWRDVSLMVEAERSLRESEEKYRQIFSVASDALFMVDYQTGKIADTNPTACQLYGYRRDELLSMTMMDLSTAPDQLLGQISAQASILVSEVCVKKNGDRFPVEMSLSYFNWGGRKVVFVSVRDISERIASQEKLIKSELKFKQLFDFSNDAILILRNYRIIDYNQKASSIFDLRHGSLANKTLWSISPGYQNSGEDSRINAVELLQDTLAGNQHQIEWLFQRSDSSTFVADVKLSPILYGNEKVIQAIIRDITPQKETETVLKKNEERWKYALEGSSIGVMDWDLIGNHIYFSPVLKSMLGFQESEMAHTFEEFEKRIHTDDVMRVFDYINEYLSGKRNHYNIEYRIQCKNGSYKWVWGRGKVASFTPDGSPARFVGTIDDVTKTKIIEQNYASEIQKLKQTAFVLKTGYWELDLRTMIFHGQPETFSILGFDPQPLHLKKLEKIVHPDDKDIFIAQFDVQSQRKGELLECFRIIVDDETRHIQSYVIPQFDQRSTLAGFIGAFQDITIHKTVEAEQVIKQNIYSALNEQLNFALIIVQNEQVVYSNKKAYEITGYAENELHSPYFSVLSLIASGSREEFQKKILSIGSSKSKNFIAEYELITKHNRSKWVEVSAVSISFLEDQALLLLFSDNTQLKNIYLESQMNESTFKAMVDFSNVVIALYNEERQIVACNNRYHYFIGGAMHKQGAPSVKSENEAIILNVIEKRRQGLTNAASNTAELSIEGEKIWVSIEAQYDPNKMLSIQITDIDQLKQSELAAMSDTLALRSLIDQSATAYALFDRKMELVFANRAFSKMFQPILSVRPLSFASLPFASHSDSVLFTEQYGRNELSNKAFVYSDYKEKHLTIGLSSYEVNQSRFFSLAVVDETVVQTEINNLKRNIEKYLSLFEASPLGMAVIDRNRNIINSNSAFYRLTGFTPNSAQLKRVDDFVHIENLSEVISDFSQLFSGVRKHINARHRIVSSEEKSAWIKSDLNTFTDSYVYFVFAV
jgi:PAS domain S-box-containing protein